jgi:hypothetical protein
MPADPPVETSRPWENGDKTHARDWLILHTDRRASVGTRFKGGGLGQGRESLDVLDGVCRLT